MFVTAVVGHADGYRRWSGYQAADKEICTRSIWENASKNETHKKRRVEISSLAERVWSKPRVNNVLTSPIKRSWRVCKALNSVFRTRVLVASALFLGLCCPICPICAIIRNLCPTYEAARCHTSASTRPATAHLPNTAMQVAALPTARYSSRKGILCQAEERIRFASKRYLRRYHSPKALFDKIKKG